MNPIETQLTQALEQQPTVAIPADFATRVALALPRQPRRRRPAMPVARIIAIAASLLLTLTIFALAPRATPSFTNFAFDLELLLLVQLAGIGYWFTDRRHS